MTVNWNVILTRTTRWGTFVIAAIAINALAFLFARSIPRPEVGIGAALDVAVTVPALYLLLIVRAGLQPALSTIPLFLLGLVRATYLAPGIAPVRPLVAVAAEVAVIALIVTRVRRGGVVARMLASELDVLRYAFAMWRSKPDVPMGARAYTIHEQSGVAILMGFLAGLSVMEAALVHLMVAQWNVTVAWVLTAISVYGGVWLIAVARSFALRPVLLTCDELIVRAGLLWTVRVPLDSITVERPGERAGAACDLRVPILADPNLILRLSEPATAYGMFGMTRRVSTIALAMDDAADVAGWIKRGFIARTYIERDGGAACISG